MACCDAGRAAGGATDVILLGDVIAVEATDAAANPATCVAEGLRTLFSVVPFGKGFTPDVFLVIVGEAGS